MVEISEEMHVSKGGRLGVRDLKSVFSIGTILPTV